MSQVTSLPEVAAQGGLLVNPYSAGDLSIALKEITVNQQLRSSLIEKGFAQAKKFSWEKAAAEVLNSFKIL